MVIHLNPVRSFGKDEIIVLCPRLDKTNSSLQMAILFKKMNIYTNWELSSGAQTGRNTAVESLLA